MQARAAVAGLLLVAPYACHWRNITLQRRYQAQAQAASRMVPVHGLHAFGHDYSYTRRANAAQMHPEVGRTSVYICTKDVSVCP